MVLTLSSHLVRILTLGIVVTCAGRSAEANDSFEGYRGALKAHHASALPIPPMRVAQLIQANSPAQSSTSKPELNSQQGLWAASCPEKEQCRISQSVVTASTKEPILVARAFKSPAPVLMVTAPQGIYLAPGLALMIDGGKSRRYPFETCTSEGCHTGIKIDDALSRELAKGKEAKVSFFDGAQRIVTVVLSLDGFAQAYAGLK